MGRGRSWVEGKANSMLKILTSAKDESVILTLIGRIEGENLEELKRLMGSEASGPNLVLDMKDVILVNQRFGSWRAAKQTA
jgi:anti-anti-sigma regulatory factor